MTDTRDHSRPERRPHTTMRKYSGIPELLEQFMQEQEAEEQWITVQELRDRFGLTRYQCNTISGFLRRLEFGTFGRFSYRVIRIEHVKGAGPSDPPKCRYLIKRKDLTRTGIPDMMDQTCVMARCSVNPRESQLKRIPLCTTCSHEEHT